MIRRWLQARREAKIIQALVLLKMEELRRTPSETTLLKSLPYFCKGEDCETCCCDLGQDCD